MNGLVFQELYILTTANFLSVRVRFIPKSFFIYLLDSSLTMLNATLFFFSMRSHMRHIILPAFSRFFCCMISVSPIVLFFIASLGLRVFRGQPRLFSLIRSLFLSRFSTLLFVSFISLSWSRVCLFQGPRSSSTLRGTWKLWQTFLSFYAQLCLDVLNSGKPSNPSEGT